MITHIRKSLIYVILCELDGVFDRLLLWRLERAGFRVSPLRLVYCARAECDGCFRLMVRP